MKASAGYRVLMLLENNPFPRDIRVRREARALVEAGYQVSVICPAAPGQPWHETVNTVCIYRFPAPRPGNGFLGYFWEYSYAMAATFILSLLVFFRESFDIIHAHNPPDTFVFIAAFYKLLGKRFVFDHHDLTPENYYARFGGNGNRFVYLALVWLEKLSCRLADHIIATNESYKAMEMGRGGVPAERITIVRNGPDLNGVRPVEPDPKLRRTGKTIVGYVGVMGFQDGVDYLLRALRHLVYDLQRTDVFCIIIGAGDAWASLKKLATELGLNKYVWFTGRVSDDDLIRYLSAADICVDPDPSNPFNDRCTMIKMTEYMALGKPIVAFDLPEHRVTAQAAALYVPPNDELEFARALAQLMDDPARRQAMGSFGRRRIEMELAWRYSVPKLLEAYRTLFPEPPGESLPSYDTIQKGDRMIVRDSSTPGHLCLKRDPDGSLSAGYHIRISHAAEDPEWDAFLAETPGGHHVQTSLWAQVKAALGWRIARIVVTQGEHIVAGGQVLLRPLPVVGAIGYVPRGPLFAVDDPVLAELVINELHQVARVHRVQYLVVQPPCNGEALAHSLSTWGFRPSKIEVAPTATVVIDLSMDLDDILGQMKSKTRYNIRHGQRKGITVREGTERDLSTFHRLLVATSRRQKFPSEPEEYYVKMWRVLGSRGYAKLFLGELEGEPVSALLAISFGDTVIYKRGAWSGCHGGRHPNYVLQWAAIMWAKSHGYHYYDLEGIELEAALAIMDDEPIPDSLKQSVTSFKLGFGGEMVLHPGAYDYVYHPLLRRAYNIVFPKIANWSVTKTALHRFRTH